MLAGLDVLGVGKAVCQGVSSEVMSQTKIRRRSSIGKREMNYPLDCCKFCHLIPRNVVRVPRQPNVVASLY